MSYQHYNIKDEIAIMKLCGEIVELEREIDALRLKIGRLQDQKIEINVEIDKIREAARASLESGTLPLPPST